MPKPKKEMKKVRRVKIKEQWRDFDTYGDTNKTKARDYAKGLIDAGVSFMEIGIVEVPKDE